MQRYKNAVQSMPKTINKAEKLYFPPQIVVKPLHRNTGFSAVGSALRSGRRGRAFESPNPDCKQERLPKGSLSCLCLFAPGGCPELVFSFFERQVGWARDDKSGVSFAGKAALVLFS